MPSPIARLPIRTVTVDAKAVRSPLEAWRHALGQGGVSPEPLPQRVLDGVRLLRPRLIRVFIQQFFDVYPAPGRFDWTALDAYLRPLAGTGAKVVAAITVKPPVLFPTVDHAIWQPADVGDWQRVIFQLVKRYSVDTPIVTHWEVGNETDIGELGGAPFLIPTPDAYGRFYRTITAPILDAFPEALVGGPASCWIENEPLPGFVEECKRNGARLDFISWHLYSDDPGRHALGVRKAKAILDGYPGQRPEMMVTEWSKGFERSGHVAGSGAPPVSRPVSVEDMAFEPRRAAITAASIVAMIEAGVDWTFYYHLWDQAIDPDVFEPFFSTEGIGALVEHWNEVPHRFALFGVGGEVRPQYFVFQILSQLGDQRLAVEADAADLHVLAARDDRTVSTLIANLNPEESHDCVAEIRFTALTPGRKALTTYRIDRDRRWSAASLELEPVEQRSLFASSSFRCQVYVPADGVVSVRLADEEDA